MAYVSVIIINSYHTLVSNICWRMIIIWPGINFILIHGWQCLSLCDPSTVLCAVESLYGICIGCVLSNIFFLAFC